MLVQAVILFAFVAFFYSIYSTLLRFAVLLGVIYFLVFKF